VAWVFVRTIAQHAKEEILFPTHTKQKQKEQLKLKNLKNSIEKNKRRGKRKLARKKINKIFKSYTK